MDAPITVSGGFQMVMQPNDNQVCRALSAGLPWEEHTTRIIRESLHEGDVFVDCGAHIGWFSIVASKLVGPKGKVHAFEPWDGNFEVLVENLRLNACDNVIAHNTPLWSSDAEVRVYTPPPDNSGDGRVVLQDAISVKFKNGDKHEFITEGEGYTVRTAKFLDELFPPDSVQFVKIDCQGADGDVLLGGRRLFTESKKIRFMVEDPRGIPESEFGIPLKLKTDDNNFYYEKVGP